MKFNYFKETGIESVFPRTILAISAAVADIGCSAI